MLTETEGFRIVKPDIAGVKSIIEALRSGIADSEDVLIASVQKAKALSSVRNEADVALRDKFGVGNRS